MALFSREFLDELTKHVSENDVLHYYMCDMNMTFEEAILRLAKFHNIKPVYFERQQEIADKFHCLRGMTFKKYEVDYLINFVKARQVQE